MRGTADADVNTITFSAAISACEKWVVWAALCHMPGVLHGSVGFSAAELERPPIQVLGENQRAQHAAWKTCSAG